MLRCIIMVLEKTVTRVIRAVFCGCLNTTVPAYRIDSSHYKCTIPRSLRSRASKAREHPVPTEADKAIASVYINCSKHLDEDLAGSLLDFQYLNCMLVDSSATGKESGTEDSPLSCPLAAILGQDRVNTVLLKSRNYLERESASCHSAQNV
ncbi:hypothetical protein ElyMa_006197500 [Elysia marginata]|uniref:Uncharacterized protein n=1 Tax=Elysia marginata TaxID=1093978 RepID=A0AAV4H6D2_9GAST|nr:hypothetical protein ElyMa_006197500 [Elysia marginata]